MGEELKPKWGSVLVFSPGTLTINKSGYGEHDGDAEFQFDEDAVDILPHDDRAGNYILVTVPASEITAIRNFLNRNTPRAPDATLPEKLRGLYREVDALGGAIGDYYDAGYNRAIERALDVLESAGFWEGGSIAADTIDASADAAFMEEVRGGLDRITDLEQARRSGGPVPEDLDGLDDALAEAVTIAADLLAKMEGK